MRIFGCVHSTLKLVTPFSLGKGLTLVTSILEGRSVDMKAEAIAAKEVGGHYLELLGE